MSASTEIRRDSKPSPSCANLTVMENEQVLQLIGSRCQSLCTSVAQLYVTQGPHHSHWVKKHTGVLCFVKDNIRRSYFLRMFCLSTKELVWEHEIYYQMDISQSRPFLLTFEGHDCLVALNFASVDEAIEYQKVAMGTIRSRNKKREERKSQPVIDLKGPSILQQNTLNIKGSKNNKKLRPKITKADISTPSNFQHISHVGSNDKFNLSGENVALRPFLQKAGISEAHLNNRQTRNFIMDFIQKNNVTEIAQKEALQRDPPSVPPRNTDTVDCSLPTTAPRRPPPPLPASKPQLGARPVINPVGPGGPPPPPPPPLMDMAMPPPPEPLKPNSSQSAKITLDPRDELLNSIRGGKKLRPIEASSIPAPSIGGDSRDDLLNAIRAGKNLKPVPVERKDNSGRNSVGTDVLANALNEALRKRQAAFDGSSGSESDTEDPEVEDWD